VTKAKYINKIKYNLNVSSIFENVSEKTVKEERNYKNYSPLMSDYSVSPIWSLIFHVSSFLTLINALIIICFFIY